MTYVACEYTLIFISFMIIFNLLPLHEYPRFFINIFLFMIYMIGLINGIHEILFNVSGTVFIGE